MRFEFGRVFENTNFIHVRMLLDFRNHGRQFAIRDLFTVNKRKVDEARVYGVFLNIEIAVLAEYSCNGLGRQVFRKFLFKRNMNRVFKLTLSVF